MNPLLAPNTLPTMASTIDAILEKYIPPSICAFLAERGTKIIVVSGANAFCNASPALQSLGARVDDWPTPPAGLFVVSERTLYIRQVSAMTVVHELGHAFDLALGGDVYSTCANSNLRALYADETNFITPYAASAIDEWFAESFRAMCEANDDHSLWPRATRVRLRRSTIHATMVALFESFGVATDEVAA